MADTMRFPIGFVSMMTGLSAHVLRAWERRYHVVTPRRTSSGHRLYSQADIDRLALLKQAVSRGHSISQIAVLDDEALGDLIRSDIAMMWAAPKVKSSDGSPEPADDLYAACLRAVEMLDASALKRCLQQASLSLSRPAMIDTIIRPLMETIGERWSGGSLRIVHEHLASQTIHSHFSAIQTHDRHAKTAKPCLLVATPAGQLCHLGAMAVAAIARDHGWHSIFLGPDLPGEEIAAACTMVEPQMIALSITCRVNDAFMEKELLRLSELIDDDYRLVIGGLASERYRSSIEAAGATFCPTADEFTLLLH